MSPLDERRLVRRFLAGDERAFDLLYDRHAPAMYQFALRLMGGREHDAEDVVQDAWLRASDALWAFRWRSQLRTWLMGVTLNCAREALRHRQRSIPAAGPAGIGPERLGGSSEMPDVDLERAIEALAVDLRLVLILHDLEGFTHAEVGERLGIAEGTSKSRLSRARRQVRDTLTAEETP